MNSGTTGYTAKTVNANLKWEKTDQIDFGIDMGFLQNRLNLTFDYYQKNTSDLLLTVSTPYYLGSDQIYRNIGKVRNRGLEFSINAIPIQTKDIYWEIQANIARNRNRIMLDKVKTYSNKISFISSMSGIIFANFDTKTNILNCLSGEGDFKGYSMRPLVMDFEGDATVNNISDQFMFGPALMVSPVYRFGERTREVYFPKAAGWYDFYTGQFRNGGEKSTVEAPYERIPLYVRAGSIIPVGPEIQYVAEKPADNILLYVYRGDNAAFTLYEDENVNYNYEKGKYATIPFTYDNGTNTLTIGTRKGSFAGMLKSRTFTIVTVDKNNPKPFDADASGKEVKYNGSQVVVTL